MRVRVRIDGEQNLRAAMRDVRRRYPRAILNPATKKVAEVGLRELRRTRRYRDRTGNLRRSSRIAQFRRTGGRFGIGWELLSGGSSARYAAIVNALTGYFDAATQKMSRIGFGVLTREARRQHRRFNARNL